MKTQNYILVPRFRSGLHWTVMVAVATLTTGLLLPVFGSGYRQVLFVDKMWILKPVDAVVAAQLVLLLGAALVRSPGVPWREADLPRTLYCFRSAPPEWSWWYALMVAVTYAIPHASGAIFDVEPWMTGARAEVPGSEIQSLFGIVHVAFLIVLASSALWSWVTWIRAFTPVTFGGSKPPALKLYGSGSTLMLEHDHGVEMLRVFGLADGAWDPSCLLVRDRMPTYRLSSEEALRVDDLNIKAPIKPAEVRLLVLPVSIGRWVAVALVASILTGAFVATGWSALVPFLVVAAVGVGLLLRDERPSSGFLHLKLWNWDSSVPGLRRVYVGAGVAAWGLLFTLQAGGITVWTLEVLCIAFVLWIPFWVRFVEPRRFIRLRKSRLQLRMRGVWLPITDVHARDERLLDLYCGPLRVPLGPQVWMGAELSGPVVAERMRPYLSFWDPPSEVTQ